MTTTGLTNPVAGSVVMGRIFPGLRPFEEQDAALFFGRDEQVDSLLQRLQDTRFLAILGLSGSGKSSLVRAGLLPALRRGHVSGAGSRWRIGVMRPGADPLGTLGRTLDDALGPLEDRDVILRSGRLGLVDASRAGRGPDENLLLVVDQFEEIFRVSRGHRARGEAAEFVRLLLAAVQEYEEQYRIYVVITMRSDYLGETALFPGLPEALNESQYLVPRMTRPQLREAIEGPAALGGVEVDPDLVEQLLQKTGEDPDELPVLQHLLMRMWEVREEMSGSARMRMAHLERVGGWDKALTNHATSWHGRLEPERRILAKRIFQRLTEKGEASRESRRPTKVRELAAVAEVVEDEVKAVVEHFRQEGCNFLTASDQELTGGSVIDISHESLIRRWEDLRKWVDEEGESGKWYQRVEDASLLHSRGEGGWLVGPQLESALNARAGGRWNAAWAKRYTAEPGRPVPALAGGQPARAATDDSPGQGEGSSVGLRIPPSGYVRATAFLDGSQRAQTRRGARRLLIALGSAVAATALLLSWTTRRRSEESARLRASIAVEDPLARALLLREFAHSAGEPEIRDYHAAATAPIPLTVLRAPRREGAMIAAAFGVDGPGEVATVSDKGVVRWWGGEGMSACFVMGERATGGCSNESLPPETLTAAAFSPDGRRVAAARRDGSAWVGLSDGSGVRVSIPSRGKLVYLTALAFSPDGQTLLAGYNDYEAWVWTLPALTAGSPGQSATPRAVLGTGEERHKGPISGVAFDPGGKRVATSSMDRTIRVWRLDDPSKAVHVLRLPGDEGDLPLSTVVFSPDGQWLLGAYPDTARVWRSDGRGSPTRLPNQARADDNVFLKGAWFSPDSSRVVMALSDGTAQVVSVAARGGTPEPGAAPDEKRRLEAVGSPRALSGHEGVVHAAAFTADARKIVTVAEDGTARVWWSEPGEPRILGRHDQRVESVAFSSDGTRVVSASRDKTAAMWRIDGSAAPFTLSGHKDWVRAAAFSPDGTKAVTASEDGTLSLWQIAGLDGNGAPIRVIKDSPTLSVAFDASGSRVITAGKDNSAKIWDTRRIFNLEVGVRSEQTLRGHTDWVWSAAFSPHGSTVVTASADGTARVWQTESGEQLASLDGHQDRVLSAAFSPDGSRIVTASADRTARIWKKEGPGWVETITLRHDGGVNRAAFSPDGQWLVTSSDDQTARIWNAGTGVERLVLRHGAPVRAACFSPDNSYVVSGSEDGRVRLWRVTLASISAYLKEASTACLDPGLRVRYLGESEKSAESRYEDCETRHGRVPPRG